MSEGLISGLSHDRLINLAAADRLLKQFDCNRLDREPVERSILQQAVQQVAEASDYQILGICADSLEVGLLALQQYALALNYSLPAHLPEPAGAELTGSVYIKFNPRSGFCHASPYSGSHRGVLVSCQPAGNQVAGDQAAGDRPAGKTLCETYGHLPIDLFTDLPTS